MSDPTPAERHRRIHDLAELLVGEHDRRTPFHSLTSYPEISDLNDAYAVQDAFVRRLSESQGDPVGFKIALTASRMQELCGIDQPLAGVLLSRRVHTSGATVQLADFVRIGLECEIAVRLGAPLVARPEPYEFAEVEDAIAAVAPAFELIDDRGAAYDDLDAISLAADNAWNAGVVLGEWVTTWPDLDDVEGMAFVDSRWMDSGRGRDVLGHPVLSLKWLADQLGRQGKGLRPGDIVMTGSLVPTRNPVAGESYRFSLAGVGDVTVRFEP